MGGAVGPVTKSCTTVGVDGSEAVHLASDESGGAESPRTLCDRPVSATPPTRRFQLAGCASCAEAGLDRGILVVRERGRAMVSLPRFHRRLAAAGVVPAQRPPGPGQIQERNQIRSSHAGVGSSS